MTDHQQVQFFSILNYSGIFFCREVIRGRINFILFEVVTFLTFAVVEFHCHMAFMSN